MEVQSKVIRESVRHHATSVAAIVISGEPKIDEPLVRAWERTLAHHQIDLEHLRLNNDAAHSAHYYCPESSARHEFRAAAGKMYPAIVEDPDYHRSQYWWDPSIVHSPESARFTEIFSTAPVWLLEFTKMEVDASVLEFNLPDMSAELIWGSEGIKDSERWPLLPLGTMAAGDPVRAAPEEFWGDLSPEERHFYQEMKERPEEEWSRLERRRMRGLVERLSPKNS